MSLLALIKALHGYLPNHIRIVPVTVGNPFVDLGRVKGISAPMKLEEIKHWNWLRFCPADFCPVYFWHLQKTQNLDVC